MGLKIAVLPADVGGCGRYRLIHAALILKEQGYDIDIYDPAKPMPIAVLANEHNEISDVQVQMEADVIVVQRVASAPHVEAIKLLRAKGYTVVLDLDDDMGKIHPGNKAFNALRPTPGARMGWQYAELAAQAATMVTVSTKILLTVYARHGRGFIIDNYIPQRYLTLHHVDQDRYGWPGSIESHPDDLLAVGNAAQRLAREGHTFIQVGPYQKEVLIQLGLDEYRATGPTSLKLWAATVATLGVAWAPLTDTLFNAAKSRLKILEANAVGVPYVASPRAEYTRMTAEGGAGLLAAKPKDWYRQTKRLLEDHSLRRDLSAQAREYAATQTIEEHAWRTMEAWNHAYNLQHGRVPTTTTVDLGSGRTVATVGRK
jgi:glycosyltransferase involved in cell wall biosynthesis